MHVGVFPGSFSGIMSPIGLPHARGGVSRGNRQLLADW